VTVENDRPLVPEKHRIDSVTRETALESRAAVLSTRDPEAIREWARGVGAEPATGEATASGPAAPLKVADGGTGLRFNFPGMSPFRVISWAEWFEHFNGHDLTFVYDNVRAGQSPSARYRIVPTAELAT
jgi:hypothetical protein